MPSTFGHIAAGLAVAAALGPPEPRRRVWGWAAVCAALPDIDYLGAPFGFPAYSAPFGGHRGLTHSLAVAAALGAAVAWGAFRGRRWAGQRLRLWGCFALAAASHGLLDALTTNGPGVALLAPLSEARFTATWHPVDPAGAAAGLRGGGRLAAVLANEAAWIWLPAAALTAILLRRRRRATVAAPAA